MPKLEAEADRSFASGPINYTAAWVLLVFVGPLGLHRFYLGKPLTGLLYLLTFGVFLLGVIYDWWTMNQQISTPISLADITDSAPKAWRC